MWIASPELSRNHSASVPLGRKRPYHIGTVVREMRELARRGLSGGGKLARVDTASGRDLLARLEGAPLLQPGTGPKQQRSPNLRQGV